MIVDGVKMMRTMISNHFVLGCIKMKGAEKYLLLDPPTGNIYAGNIQGETLFRDAGPLTYLDYLRLAADADGIDMHQNSYIISTGPHDPIKINIRGIEFFEPVPLDQKFPC